MNVDITIMPARPQDPLPSEPFHRWILADGRSWTEFHRTGAGYLVRFPGLADFEIAADGAAATCRPVPGADAPTTEHLCDNQVRPLMLSLQGRLVFHGSAVVVDGGAIAFLGESGLGKSTLAAGFATRGHPFLTDDAMLLERTDDGGYLVLPSHAALRLWDDSRHALLPADAATAPPTAISDKQRFLAARGLPHTTEPRPLLAAFFLVDEGAQAVTIAPLTGARLLAAWTLQAFVLDVEDRQWLDRRFHEDVALAAAVPSFTLDFRRSFDDLEDLMSRLIEHTARISS